MVTMEMVFPEDTREARKKASAAWAVWWKDNSAKVDLARLAPSSYQTLGYTVVCEHNTGRKHPTNLASGHRVPPVSRSWPSRPLPAGVFTARRVTSVFSSTSSFHLS